MPIVRGRSWRDFRAVMERPRVSPIDLGTAASQNGNFTTENEPELSASVRSDYIETLAEFLGTEDPPLKVVFPSCCPPR